MKTMNSWHRWAEEKPGTNGEYLIVTDTGMLFLNRFCDGTWLDAAGDDMDGHFFGHVELWAEIPELPDGYMREIGKDLYSHVAHVGGSC